MARFRVTFVGRDEAVSFHTDDLHAEAYALVITACVRLALAHGLTLRIERLTPRR